MQKYAKQDWVGKGVPLNLLHSYNVGTGSHYSHYYSELIILHQTLEL